MPRRHRDYFAIKSLDDLQEHTKDSEGALRLLEWLRWPEGRRCPNPECEGLDHNELRARRAGLYECRDCGRQFSATSGTPLHATKLPLGTWLMAMYLIVSSSKGVSSVTLARQIGVSQPTAWKIGHAIRLMMRPAPDEVPLAGVVEVDDLADGGEPARQNRAKYGAAVAKHMHNPRGRGSKKRRLLVMTEREGRVRTAPMPDGKVKTVKPIIHRAASRDAHLMTDGDRTMVAVGKTYRAHSAVNHSDKEYARDDAHINTAEAFNLFLRRAKIGVWHQWGENHQQRYVEQIQFHWDHRPKTRKVDGKRHRVSNETPIIERMQRLFAIGSGRQIRWTATKGIKEIEAPTPPQQPSAPQDVGRSL